jgi:hypothetical protein
VSSLSERNRQVLRLKKEVEVLRFWIERIAQAQDADRNWQGLGAWTRMSLKDAIAEADAAAHNGG